VAEEDKMVCVSKVGLRFRPPLRWPWECLRKRWRDRGRLNLRFGRLYSFRGLVCVSEVCLRFRPMNVGVPEDKMGEEDVVVDGAVCNGECLRW
jgi:hypothetical protein